MSLILTGNSSTLTVDSTSGITFPNATLQTVAAQTGPAFSAYRSTNQSLSAGANTKIQYDTEEFDTANCYDNSTNYRFTPNVAGYYQFTVSAANNNGGTYQQCMVYKNGSQAKASNLVGSCTSSLVTALVYMNGTTDYVEGWTYTGGTAVTSGSITTYFQGFLARVA